MDIYKFYKNININYNFKKILKINFLKIYLSK